MLRGKLEGGLEAGEIISTKNVETMQKQAVQNAPENNKTRYLTPPLVSPTQRALKHCGKQPLHKFNSVFSATLSCKEMAEIWHYPDL